MSKFFWLPTSATLQVNTINCKHSFLSLKTLPKNDPRKIICMWTSFSVLALEMHKYKGFQFSKVMHFVWVLIQLEISRFWNLPQKERKHLQFKLPRSSPVNFWYVRNERNPDDKVTRVGILEKYVGLQSYLPQHFTVKSQITFLFGCWCRPFLSFFAKNGRYCEIVNSWSAC